MDRREFAAALAAAAATGVGKGARAQTAASGQGTQKPQDGAGATPVKKPFQIGMIIFNNMIDLDFVGPHDVLSQVPDVKVTALAKTLDPVTTDSRLRLLPQARLSEAPPLDMLFIGGGFGTTQLMEDREVIDFLVSRAPTAQYITSVCTGALVLGAAGLLKGYKATTHWTAMGVLPIFGAEPVHERVVFDRNRITGGGVTAGIDFGLAVVGKIWGDEQAQIIQLTYEYAPKPPYNAGSPDTAPPAIKERVVAMFARTTNLRMEAARRAMVKIA